MDTEITEESQDTEEAVRLRGVSKTQCGGCLQYFTGMTIFDNHRIGAFGKDRRCMTEDEMIAAGWAKEPRMVLLYRDGKPAPEERDVWFDVQGRELMRQRFADMPLSEVSTAESEA